MSHAPSQGAPVPRVGRSSRRHRANRRGKLFLIPTIQILEDRTMLAVDYWTGASARSNGSDGWSNAGNWSLGVPGPSDTADFSSSQSQVGTAVVNAAETVGSVVIDNTWGGTLDVNNALTVTGNFTLASGMVGGTATLTASGSGSQWTGGTLNSTLANAGTLTLPGTSQLNLSGALDNTGTVAVTGGATLVVSDNSTITNAAGATFDLASDGALYPTNGATGMVFNNAGTLEKTAGTGVSTVQLPVNNSGAIAGDSGTLQLTGGGTGIGADTVDADADGTVSLCGSFSGTFAGSGAGIVELSSSILFSPAFTGAGTGATLDFTGGVLQWRANAVAGTVTNLGTLAVTGNAGLTLSGTFTNTGTVVVNGGASINATDNTAIDNQAGATFDLDSDDALNPANGATGMAFNNAGLLEKTGGIGISSINVPVNNSGRIEGDTNTLQLFDGGSGIGNATIDAAAGAAVTLSGSFSGTFAGSGAGTVGLSSRTQFSPAFTGAGTGATLDFTGGVLQWSAGAVAGTVTNLGTLTVTANSGLTLSGTFTNAGTVVVNAGASINATDNTAIDNQAGATFDLASDAALNPANGAIGMAFNNAGLLEKTAGTGVSPVRLPVNGPGTVADTSGTLDLAGGGTGANAVITAGAGGTVSLEGTFSGTFSGSGGGSVLLADQGSFTGSGLTLDFPANLLQWVNGNGVGGTITNAGNLTISGAPALPLRDPDQRRDHRRHHDQLDLGQHQRHDDRQRCGGHLRRRGRRQRGRLGLDRDVVRQQRHPGEDRRDWPERHHVHGERRGHRRGLVGDPEHRIGQSRVRRLADPHHRPQRHARAGRQPRRRHDECRPVRPCGHRAP